MSTKNVQAPKPIVNKVLERVKEQEERNHTLMTQAEWPAQGGLFGRANHNRPKDQQPEDIPVVALGKK
ncbi:hypothetical protein [Legionella tunisiensis]|uniref:hypothetical protein n=1 Tax=Legionella tunisiensis TaxID=1034944 RepID=UPI0002FD5B56|nr:hypothetical protein [Legionella tunisiensis]